MTQQPRYLPHNTLTKIRETNDDVIQRNSKLPVVIVPPLEAEELIEALRSFSVEEIGSSAFLRMYACQVERLCLQAHSSAAAAQGNEYVVGAILRHGKLTTIIETLLAIEVWRTQVLPLLLEKLSSQNSLRCAFLLHVETTIVGLINLCLFQRHGVEALDDGRADASVALVDYTARCLVQLATPLSQNPMVQRQKHQQQESSTEDSTTTSLQNTIYDTHFFTCVASVTTARYLTEYMDALPLSAQARILDTHDFLLLMIPLIEEPPWSRKTSSQPSKWEKLLDHQWQTIPASDLLHITKCEAQPWLTLYFVACPIITAGDYSTTSRERYTLTSYRKEQLLRLRRYLNDLLLDQLPVLVDLRRYMDELLLMDVTSASASPNIFLLQPIDSFRENLLVDHRRGGMNWTTVATTQWDNLFSHVTDATDEDLKRVVEEVYSDTSTAEEEKTEQERQQLMLPISTVQLTSTTSNHSFMMEPAPSSTATVPTALGNFRRIQLLFPSNRSSSPFTFSAMELDNTAIIITAVVTFTAAQNKTSTTTLSGKLSLAPKGKHKKKQWFQLGSVQDGIILQLGFVSTPISSDTSSNDAAIPLDSGNGSSETISYSLEQVFLSQPEHMI